MSVVVLAAALETMALSRLAPDYRLATDTVTVTGTGGNLAGTGSQNRGVWVIGSDSQITSSGGDIHVTGIGGGGSSSFGIQVIFDGRILATTGTPAVSLTADSMDLASTVSIMQVLTPYSSVPKRTVR